MARGRPPWKLTKDLIEAIATQLLAGNTIKCACALNHVQPSTYFMWMQQAKALQQDINDKRIIVTEKSDKLLLDLLESVTHATARCESRQVGIIQQAAAGVGKFERKGPDPRWALAWLRIRVRQDWGKASETESTSTNAGIRSVQDEVRAMIQSVTGTPEQLAEMMKEPLEPENNNETAAREMENTDASPFVDDSPPPTD